MGILPSFLSALPSLDIPCVGGGKRRRGGGELEGNVRSE